MLGENFTREFLLETDLKSLSLFKLIFSDSKRIEECLYIPFFRKLKSDYRGIWGCNWGVKLDDLMQVNGFDEDYVLASVGEDNDIEWRLRKSGVDFKSLKHKAIVYHMYHKENYDSDATKQNLELFEHKKKTGRIRCLNGLLSLSN